MLSLEERETLRHEKQMARDLAGCPHDWGHLERKRTNKISSDGVSVPVIVDEFYCRKCLEYREVKR